MTDDVPDGFADGFADDFEQGFTDDFARVLRHLRGLSATCAPPVGVGAFDVLYVSAREIVVWYLPAREEHREGEHAIPTACLEAAWAALLAGAALDVAALAEIGAGEGRGRWLLAVLAQVPGVRVREEPLALLLDLTPPAPSPTGRGGVAEGDL